MPNRANCAAGILAILGIGVKNRCHQPARRPAYLQHQRPLWRSQRSVEAEQVPELGVTLRLRCLVGYVACRTEHFDLGYPQMACQRAALLGIGH